MGLKQARCVGFVFPREFFVSGVTCSARAPSVVLVWRLEMAAWRHRGKLSSAIVEFVAPLRLWHSLRPPPMVGFVERESGGPASRSALRAFERAEFRSARELQEGREKRGAPLARRFKQSVFWTSLKAAGPIRASVRGGAPPARLVFCKAFSCEDRTCLYPCYSNSYRVYTFILSPHSLSYWFIQFCNHS